MLISDWGSDVCSSELSRTGKTSQRRIGSLARLCREHRRHLLPDLVDRLERSDHHLEILDLPFVIPADDVDPVDLDSIKAALELEHRLIAVDDLAQIAEIVAAEDMARGMEIGEDLVGTFLRDRKTNRRNSS